MMQIQILPITMIHMDFTNRVMGKNMSKQIFHLKITVNSADFSCYADNESCDQSFIASVNEFSGDTLSTGRKINFSVVFAVPVDAESIELEYTANIWSSEKVIIKLQ